MSLLGVSLHISKIPGRQIVISHKVDQQNQHEEAHVWASISLPQPRMAQIDREGSKGRIEPDKENNGSNKA